MAFLDTIALKIRRREGPVYEMIYRVAKGVNTFNVPDSPVVRKVAQAAYAGQVLVREASERAKGVLGAEPLFRSRCESVCKRRSASGGTSLPPAELQKLQGDTHRITLRPRSCCSRMNRFISGQSSLSTAS